MRDGPIRCTCGLSYRETSSVDVPKQHNTTCAIWLLIEEEDRKRRHHDVLCLVLKELAGKMAATDAEKHDVLMLQAAPIAVNIARKYADLAYPPPKEQP